MIITLLICSILPIACSIPLADASESVYIRANGLVEPVSSPIQRNGDVYTFTSNISDSLVVQKSNVVIDGAGYTLQGPGGIFGTTAIILNENYVTIKNLKVTDFYHGIVSKGYSSHTISGNQISAITLEAIWFNSSSSNIISGNFINTYDAIKISYSSGNVISGNNIARLNGGITLSHASNNTVSKNNMTGGLGAGIYLVGSDSNSLTGNLILSGFDGINLVDSDHNDLSFNYINATRANGVRLRDSSENTISGNNITYNYEDGIGFYDSLSNRILENNIRNNGGGSLTGSSGIRFNASLYNSVSGNNITDHLSYYGGYGVWLNYSSSNIFYHNIFVNNTEQVHSLNSTNVWDNGYPSGGNYWSDYNGTDANSDGIGDTPYIIDAQNKDNYPIMLSMGPVIPELSWLVTLPLFVFVLCVALILKHRKNQYRLEKDDF